MPTLKNHTALQSTAKQYTFYYHEYWQHFHI